MKRIIASFIICASALTGFAQTDFRHITFDEAREAAKKENKLVFIDFFTTWCGPCRMMSSKVFPTQEVGNFMNGKFVAIKLDAEKEGVELAKTYGVRSYPTYVITDPTGKEVAKFSGYMDGQKFIEKVGIAMDPEQSPARIRERYLGGERTPQVVNSYAMQLMEQRKEEEGFKVVDDYFASLSDADRLKSENSFLFTVYTIDLDNDRARFMIAHRNDFPADKKDAVLATIRTLYNQHLNTYFSGYMYREGKYEAEKFNRLKKEIADYGLDPDNSNAVVYEFVEKRVGSDDAEFARYCEENFNRLDPKRQDALAMNMIRLILPDNAENKQMISTFLRRHLPTLSPIAIQYAGRTLGSIEGK